MLKQRLVRFALIHFEDQAPMMQISVKKDFVVQPREMMTANWKETPKDKDMHKKKKSVTIIFIVQNVLKVTTNHHLPP